MCHIIYIKGAMHIIKSHIIDGNQIFFADDILTVSVFKLKQTHFKQWMADPWVGVYICEWACPTVGWLWGISL